MHATARTLAAAAAAAALTLGTVTTADAATKNPVKSPTHGKPGLCTQTQNADYGGGNPMSTRYLIKQLRHAGFTRAEVPYALAVAKAESGIKINGVVRMCAHARRINGRPSNRDTGTFQINTQWRGLYARYNLDSVHDSAHAARHVYLSAGKSWRYWTSWKKGAAQKHLPEARREAAAAWRAGVK